MKKSTAISLLMATSVILSIVGCSAQPKEAPDAENELQLSETDNEETSETESAETEESTEEAAPESGDAKTETTVTVNGKDVSVLDDAEKTLADLGTPSETITDFWGETMPIYKFDSGVNLATYITDGKEYAYCMDIMKEGINTVRNIGIGNTKEEMIAAYGEPHEDKDEYERGEGVTGKMCWYEYDSYTLGFGIENGKIGMYYIVNKANNDTFGDLVDAQVVPND